jgi:hypothetical protein
MLEPSQVQQLPVIVNPRLKINKIPVISKMPRHIVHTRPLYLNSHVVPRHLRLPVGQITHHVVPRLVYVPDTQVAEVGTLPVCLTVEVTQMVLGSVPTTVTDVQAAHKCHTLVDNHYLLMVAPEEGNQHVVRVPDYLDILVTDLL